MELKQPLPYSPMEGSGYQEDYYRTPPPLSMWEERKNYSSPMDGNEPIFPIQNMDRFVILVFCFYLDFKLIVGLIGLVKYSKILCPSYPLVIFIFLCGGSLNSGNIWSLRFWKFLDIIIVGEKCVN